MTQPLGSVLLPSRTMRLWLVSFFLPAVFGLLLVVDDLLNFGIGDKPGTAAGIVLSIEFFLPALCLLLCWFFVLTSGVQLWSKLGWLVFSLIAMVLEFLAVFVAAAVFYLARHGLKGVF